MLVYIVSTIGVGPKNEKYSYVVGVCDDYTKALTMAGEEEKRRGFKYNCEITEFTMNVDVWTKAKRKIKRVG